MITTLIVLIAFVTFTAWDSCDLDRLR